MSDLTPLSAAEEQIYRDGLRDAPSVASRLRRILAWFLRKREPNPLDAPFEWPVA